MRAYGVLLSISSLPTSPVLGDLGPAAYAFCRWLKAAGASLWQVLPVGPWGPGHSPYAAPSSFAGNPLLVSPEFLAEEGLLTSEDLSGAPPAGRTVDFPELGWRWELLHRAYRAFRESHWHREAFEAFCQTHAFWLEDWALFTVASQRFGAPFWSWPSPIAHREPGALSAFTAQHQEELEAARFFQFLFFTQWERLRKEAHPLQLFGDLPFFVAAHSADVWSHPELFELDETLRPRFVAGVPPDYFSAEGQLWGNPVYRWSAHEATGFAWWRQRIHHQLSLFDLLRLDHFRAFAAAWHVPAGHNTARHGQWVPGPGERLFAALGPGLPLVAEDLGIITEDVVVLRERLGIPGMAVLQFAFNPSERSAFLPHNHRENLVVYTGTHDNNTAVGWWEDEATPEQKAFFAAYTASQEPVHQAMTRLAMASVAKVAVLPVQDILGLPSSCRLNRPGVAEGNWGFRLLAGELTDEHARLMRTLADLYQRLPQVDSGKPRSLFPLPSTPGA